MTNYECINCNRIFTRKQNYLYHIGNVNRPCSSENIKVVPISNGIAPKSTGLIKSILSSENNNIYDMILNKHDNIKNANLLNLTDGNTCVYCETSFTRHASLQRHLRERCKSKKYFDELEKLKERLNNIVIENEHLKKENEIIKNTNIINTSNLSNNNTLNKNQINNGAINNGVINNNNVSVQLVQFGNENIDDIDTDEALNVYYKSTGGNILSNVLKLINLNEKYPQNHNICISDLSRELVKIFNGKKFVVKKFKNVEGEIMYKVISNTHKIVDKIENDETIILTPNIISKLKINDISVRLINGSLPEDIVRDEIRAKEKLLKNNSIDDVYDSENDDIDSKKEREFNLEERLRIEHLQSKQQGLIDISLEKLKDELYNGKDMVENNEIVVKNKKKKKFVRTL
jgi:hypothetical protein